MIQLLFTNESNPAHYIIDFATRSKYTHVDVVVPGNLYFGAKPRGGVKFRKENKTKMKTCLVMNLDVSEEVQQKFYEFLFKQENKPYDWRACLTWFVVRDWKEDDSWFCSELVAAALMKSGFFEGTSSIFYSCSRISPSDLILLLSGRSNVSWQTFDVNN